MPKKTVPLASLPKLQAEKLSKKNAQEEAEKLDTLGQDSEVKGAKWIIEEGIKQRKEERERQIESEWKLSDVKGKIFTYGDLLLKELKSQMLNWEDQVPEGYKWLALKNSKGIVMWIRDPDGNWYAKGMKISGEPKYDLNGIFRLMIKAVNEMEKLEEKKKSKTNDEKKIILP